jgi:nitroreductase/dihydropteridine reductase
LLLNSYPQKDTEENFNHAAKQAYIAFSMAIVAAANEEVELLRWKALTRRL